MRFALSKDTIDLLDELLEKERDEMDSIDPNEEGCLLSQDEYDSRQAALNELQDLVYDYEWDEADTEAYVRACGKRLSYEEWKDDLEQGWWFERLKNVIEAMPDNIPEKEIAWKKYTETLEYHAELAVQMQDKED